MELITGAIGGAAAMIGLAVMMFGGKKVWGAVQAKLKERAKVAADKAEADFKEKVKKVLAELQAKV